MLHTKLLLLSLSLTEPPVVPQTPDDGARQALLSAMRENQRQTQGWFWSWGAALVALSATQAALAIAAPAAEKSTWAVGASLYGAGVLVHAVLAPFSPAFGPNDQASREELESAVAAQAWVAHFSRSWAAHLLGIGSGLIVGGVAWLALERPREALFHFITAVAVTELKIWTQPTGVIGLHDDLKVSIASMGAGAALTVQW